MRNGLRYLVLAVILLSRAPSTDAYWQSQAEQPPGRMASAEINALVKQALEDLLARQGLPDGNLLSGATRIAIREEMPRAAMRLGTEAVPERAGNQFYLLSRAAAQAEADRSKVNVHFITVDSPEITPDGAMIWIGVGLVAPSEPKVIILCCCTGHGQFQRSDGRWKFVKWAGMVCS